MSYIVVLSFMGEIIVGETADEVVTIFLKLLPQKL